MPSAYVLTMPPPSLCILGSINMDLVVRAPSLPTPGQTLLGGPFDTLPGGKGANQAVAAARAGASVAMIGMTGRDDFGSRMRAVLAENAVSLAAVGTADTAPTGVALITVADDTSDNTIIVAPGANALVTPNHVDRAAGAIISADVLLMQLEVPLAAVTRAAQIAKDAGVTVMLNAAPAAKLPWDLLAALDVLIVNQSEAAHIVAAATMGGDPDEVARRPVEDQLDAIERLGVSCAVMTRGADGAAVSRSRSTRRVSTFAVDAVDTVGAGDAFCGVFAARWAEHQASSSLDADAIIDAATWACAAGALATTRRGAIPSIPQRSEIIRLLCSR